MKFGLRTPSLKKRIAARTSVKRYVRHSLGFKAPRGMGWFTNPKKAAYNRTYNGTTFSIDKLLGRGRKSGGEAFIFVIVFGAIFLALYLAYHVIIGVFNLCVNIYHSMHTNEKVSLNERHVENCVNTVPACPKCSEAMVARVARRGRNIGGGFWGCSQYPRCRGTRSA